LEAKRGGGIFGAKREKLRRVETITTLNTKQYRKGKGKVVPELN
jgi:hypothetical protein